MSWLRLKGPRKVGQCRRFISRAHEQSHDLKLVKILQIYRRKYSELLNCTYPALALGDSVNHIDRVVPINQERRDPLDDVIKLHYL